ncbi:hypothetical protein FQN54_008533 [Arachnomyces sp. PD_36]|nr:hypothetical protein FQN54_008533 [Arachnomyces sp. PD_36]
MATAPAAPQQYKQPSRKGKKAWRKNVDVSEVQEGLEVVRDEVIQGGVLAEKPSEELFTIDTTGSKDVKPTQKNDYKPLKSELILGHRSAVPAVDSRKRGSSKVTDGIIEPKTKRRRGDWVSNKELQRLKNVAQAGKPVGKGASQEPGTVAYDPWAEPELVPAEKEADKLDFLEKKKPIVAPSTLKQPPISLAANGKPIPSVKNPGAAVSYNPVFQEWDNLLVQEGQKEVEAEKARIEEAKRDQERFARIEAAKDETEMKSDDESAWEGFESEYETPEWLNKKRPERKSQAQRNKIKRRKEAERKAKWEAQMKKRQNQAEQIRSIAKSMKKQDQVEKAEDSSSDEGDDTKLRRRPFGGKLPAPQKPLELVLPDELQDSLRLLKPEGNLLDDRFRNLIVRGKLESRKPIWQPKKKRVSYTEKWTHKDFQI